MFERKNEALLDRRGFYRRLLLSLFYCILCVSVSLAIGVGGYHHFENLPWIDSLLNASMILGGMGPVDPMKTIGGKLFASFYALYSGLVLIGLVAIILSPVFHRILHTFHTDK